MEEYRVLSLIIPAEYSIPSKYMYRMQTPNGGLGRGTCTTSMILSGYSGYDAFIIDSAFSRVRLTAKLGRIEYIHGTQ